MKSADPIKDVRIFSAALTIILIVIGSAHLLKGHTPIAIKLYAVAGGILFLSLFAPGILKPFHWVLVAIARKIGWVNTRVLLSVFYYLILTPMALILRFTGKDPMERKIDGNNKSYWGMRKKQAVLSGNKYERQF